MKGQSGDAFTPIVKCVGFGCNLRCRYCFYRQDPRTSVVMTSGVLESLIRETYRANGYRGSVTFIWHGGEPMIAGIKFYDRVLKLQKEHNKKGQLTINGIQTNGMLINDEWADFFKEKGFQVGVSLDGSSKYHDRFRQYYDGKGSFKDVMRGIEILREKKIPFGIVCVVTEFSVHNPDEIFRFFIENELFNIKFSRALGKDNSGNLLEFVPEPDQYGEFLMRILELWLETDDPRIRITPIVEIFSSLVRGESCTECLFSDVCDRFWIVNPNGDVYACPSEGIGSEWKFGNILEGFESIFNSPVFRKFQERTKALRKFCVKCEWYKVCKGGCTIDYELRFGTLGENVLCRSFRKLFKKAKEVLTHYGLI